MPDGLFVEPDDAGRLTEVEGLLEEAEGFVTFELGFLSADTLVEGRDDDGRDPLLVVCA